MSLKVQPLVGQGAVVGSMRALERPSRGLGERTDLGFVLLLLFGAMQWVSYGRGYLGLIVGEWVNNVAGWLNAGSVPVVVGAAAWYVRRHGRPFSGWAYCWFLAVAAIVLVLAARGFGQGIEPRFVIYDALAFVLIMAFLVIGAIPRAFGDMQRAWVWIVAAAIPLNLGALSDLSSMLGELEVGERVTHDTMSYRTQNALDVVVLALPFAFVLRGWRLWIVVGGFGLVVLQQVIYQKRLDSIYFVMLLTLSGWCWLRSGVTPLRAKYLRIVGVLAVGAALVFLGGRQLLLPQLGGLMDRFSGHSYDISYSSGFLRYLALENERFEIVADCFRGFSAKDWIFGRGMGGGVEWTGFNEAMLGGTMTERTLAAYYLPDYGFFGRRVFEVGVMTLVLKGGVLFFVIYYFGFVLMFARRSVLPRSLVERLCLVIVALQLAYSVVGGDFMLSAAFQMANTAACLGVGLSRFNSCSPNA